jgi:hypothetical protein
MSIARVKTILRRLEREISQENTFSTKSRRESQENASPKQEVCIQIILVFKVPTLVFE